jgi:hypothetical protein
MNDTTLSVRATLVGRKGLKLRGSGPAVVATVRTVFDPDAPDVPGELEPPHAASDTPVRIAADNATA